MIKSYPNIKFNILYIACWIVSFEMFSYFIGLISRCNIVWYKVFTPFYQNGCRNSKKPRDPISKPSRMNILCDSQNTTQIKNLKLLTWVEKCLVIYPIMMLLTIDLFLLPYQFCLLFLLFLCYL